MTTRDPGGIQLVPLTPSPTTVIAGSPAGARRSSVISSELAAAGQGCTPSSSRTTATWPCSAPRGRHRVVAYNSATDVSRNSPRRRSHRPARARGVDRRRARRRMRSEAPTSRPRLTGHLIANWRAGPDQAVEGRRRDAAHDDELQQVAESVGSARGRGVIDRSKNPPEVENAQERTTLPHKSIVIASPEQSVRFRSHSSVASRDGPTVPRVAAVLLSVVFRSAMARAARAEEEALAEAAHSLPRVPSPARQRPAVERRQPQEAHDGRRGSQEGMTE